MGKSNLTKAIGVRLPNELVAAIDAEASALDMSRNELLTRRLTTAFLHPREGRKTVDIGSKVAPAWEGLPE